MPASPRFVVPTLTLALCVAGVSVLSTSDVRAMQEQAAPSSEAVFLDDRIPDDQQAVLLSAQGFAVPEFDDAIANGNIHWLGNEQPTFADLEGKVVVLNTWSSDTTSNRAFTRRVGTLLKKFRDDVVQIALHTPDDADEIIAKYERHSGRLPVPTAIDTEGAYLDELGVYKQPRIIIIDQRGAIRHAGVSLTNLRDAVQDTIDNPAADGAIEALPARSERVEEEAGGVTTLPAEDIQWPAHNPIQQGNANNLQGNVGPALRVEKYLRGGTPNTDGKVIMMEFWATWCGPCIAGIPHLNDLQSAFSEDLVVVGISSEDENTVTNKMRTDQRLAFEYTIAIDPSRRIQGIVGNRGIPHCIVMSSDGIVRWQGHPSRLSESTMGSIVAANRKLGGSTGGGTRWVTSG